MLYRPFDFRFTYYTGKTRGFISMPRYELIRHMLSPNFALYVGRQGQAVGDEGWNLIFCGNLMEDYNLYRRGNNACFPLYVYPPAGRDLGLRVGRRPNLTPAFLKALAERLNLPEEEPHGLPKGVTPEDIFHYAYAVFHSPTYRSRYSEFLKIDFPRLPFTSDVELFRALAAKGARLAALHLMESPLLADFVTEFPEKGDNVVGKVRYTESDYRVWINLAQYFQGVPRDCWEFRVGGYKVCEKWLKDRKGRKLGYEDIEHYQKIVVALKETLRLMKEIDEYIPGWPFA